MAELRETILVVDDEPLVLRVTTAILELVGFEVLSASGADDALNLCRRHPGFIQLALLDFLKSGMSGFVQDLTELLPGIRIVIMSGHDLNEIIRRGGITAKAFNFVQKPFTAEALTARLTEILARPVTFVA
jgi:two-component system cell cycle sensor histidine kinase/response regulator CckA